MPEKKPPQQAAWYRYTDTASIGLEITVAIGGCTAAAYYLEQHVTHWSPWTTLIGLAIGLGAAAKALVRTARNYQRELAAQDAAASETQAGSSATLPASSGERPTPPEARP